MWSEYERYLLVFYLTNMAAGLNPKSYEARALLSWISDSGNRAEIMGEGALASYTIDPDTHPVNWNLWANKLGKLADGLRDELAKIKAKPDRTAKRLRRLAQNMALDEADIGILELMLRYKTQPAIESVIDDFLPSATRRSGTFNLHGKVLPLLLGLSMNAFQARLVHDAPLIRSGLIAVESDGDLEMVDRLRRLVNEPGEADIDATRLLLDVATPSDLNWSDFDHVGRDRDHIETLAKGALDRGALGVNILLYGPPGTGKTEFCKTLAERLGATLYTVGQTDQDGDEPSRRERLQELRLAQRLIAGNQRSMLLFDEMEDLLGDSFGAFGFFSRIFSSLDRKPYSKVYMHRLLEKTHVPTLWTINDARQVSPTVLRRMMFALELRPPTQKVRARVWARQLKRHGIEADEKDARELAVEFESTPGVAAGATAAAHLVGGGIAEVRCAVRSLSHLLSCGRPPQTTPDIYDLGLIKADTDLTALADQLEHTGGQPFSLFLQGPPGTGKSAYVRYLAERLDMELVQKRASDLLSPWLGATEQQIASAFAEARDTGAFLVFDEADSLLGDRRLAQRHWEVSQVNEMLTWMEAHPLPFACTTNFGGHLDPATLRRFVFKIALNYLSPEQVETAFLSFFSLPPPASIASLTALTPGDFAIVRRKAGLLGRLQDTETLAGMLRRECHSKQSRP